MLYLEAKTDAGILRWRLESGREWILGRHRDCDASIEDSSVSRRHLALTVEGRAVRLKDLGSTNGLWVDGNRVEETVVRPDQWFSAGTVLMTIREGVTMGDDSPWPVDRESPRKEREGLPGSTGQATLGESDSGERAVPGSWVAKLQQRMAAATDPEAMCQILLDGMRAHLGVDFVAVVSRRSEEWVIVAASGRLQSEELLERLPVEEPRAHVAFLELGDGERGYLAALRPCVGPPEFLFIGGGRTHAAFGSDMELVASMLALSRGLDARPGSDLPDAARERRAGAVALDTGNQGDRELVVASGPMRRLVAQIDRLAASDLPVFIHGESGTGKELLARRLHTRSERSRQPFVVINCAALPHDLLEAELFGIETGVATGVVARPGKFLLASGGTLFLDEVGDLPDTLQPKLLRALESGEIAPLGAPGPVPVDVRIVAASHQDLEEKVRNGEYRRDLHYRLAGAIVRVPPLRERAEEILPLARYFAKVLSRTRGSAFEGLTLEAAQALFSYSWPGNVRELRHAIARAVALSNGPILGLDALPPDIGGASDEGHAKVFLGLKRPFRDARRDFERLYIEALVERCRGNLAKAARVAGLSRSSLYRKLEELGLRGEDIS